MSDKGRRETLDVADDPRRSSGMPTGTGNGSGSGGNDKIRQEVENLAKKGYPTQEDIRELYNRYPDNETIVEEILRLSAKRHNRVKKQAREIAEKIYRRYNDGTRPLHEILDKMMKYKTQNNWSDAEYDEFRKELSYLLTGTRAMEIDYNQNIVTNRSRINKALGSTRVTQEEGLRIKESEYGVLSEILSMHEKSSSLHKSVFMHSLMYTDCSLVAMTGEFKRERHIASNYIHPVIACMFLPKFDIFEIHMLYSNFGSIVKSRYEKKPIITEPDSLLFYDITSDPNDVVCEINSPIADIRNRYKVQINLWETVLKLRNGNYYEVNPISEFISTLNACRNNLYDNADLAYNQDEGAILRRLLSVFSLRPTIIYTKPVYSVASFAAGPFGLSLGMGGMGGMSGMGSGFGPGLGSGFGSSGLGMFPFQNQPVYTITSIPMITLQIPPFAAGVEPKDLRTATSQTIWINENKTIVPKEQSIIYSKEVLIFYVNRRIQRIQIRTFTNPLPFSQLPLTMSSFERLNPYPINVPPAITLGRSEETYQLRSVVAVTQTEIRQGERTTNIITGSTGLIMSHRDFDRSIYEPKYYLYDPFGASLPVRHPEAGSGDPTKEGYITNKPVSFIEPVFTSEVNGVLNQSFFDRAQTTGTIYIYAKPSGYNPTEIIAI
ncbi:putative core protein [Tupanvirus soda lake]|uniref:Core protein n=2 Tax=Tupanvirus TaxID=2094720 RepID=A0AC62ABU8_9VIRU|nr:putative core protein [Tupanvirus soda lake]QKU35271.1 putative core protein [Tupanvirus soda lake]